MKQMKTFFTSLLAKLVLTISKTKLIFVCQLLVLDSIVNNYGNGKKVQNIKLATNPNKMFGFKTRSFLEYFSSYFPKILLGK